MGSVVAVSRGDRHGPGKANQPLIRLVAGLGVGLQYFAQRRLLARAAGLLAGAGVALALLGLLAAREQDDGEKDHRRDADGDAQQCGFAESVEHGASPCFRSGRVCGPP